MLLDSYINSNFISSDADRILKLLEKARGIRCINTIPQILDELYNNYYLIHKIIANPTIRAFGSKLDLIFGTEITNILPDLDFEEERFNTIILPNIIDAVNTARLFGGAVLVAENDDEWFVSLEESNNPISHYSVFSPDSVFESLANSIHDYPSSFAWYDTLRYNQSVEYVFVQENRQSYYHSVEMKPVHISRIIPLQGKHLITSRYSPTRDLTRGWGVSILDAYIDGIWQFEYKLQNLLRNIDLSAIHILKTDRNHGESDDVVRQIKSELQALQIQEKQYRSMVIDREDDYIQRTQQSAYIKDTFDALINYITTVTDITRSEFTGEAVGGWNSGNADLQNYISKQIKGQIQNPYAHIVELILVQYFGSRIKEVENKKLAKFISFKYPNFFEPTVEEAIKEKELNFKILNTLYKEGLSVEKYAQSINNLKLNWDTEIEHTDFTPPEPLVVENDVIDNNTKKTPQKDKPKPQKENKEQLPSFITK